ncbi:hypothetical protein AX15_007442 [Amanita polypyramis BW_CC]|nr:hypothetical protein AX15_007442 [Amanita polypyramis BW_CC]
MVEDLHITKRYFTSLKNGYQLLKAFVREWRYDLSSKGALSVDSTHWKLQSTRTRQRQATQEIKVSRITRPIESVHLFPGWAVRKFADGDGSKFDLHVHVSGYATTQRSSQNITRAQRAFLRIAKGFAAMDKYAETRVGPTSAKIFPSDGQKDDSVEDLNTSFNKAHEISELDVSDLAYKEDIPRQFLNEAPCPGASDTLLRWEDNLRSRMQLFWPTMLSSRVVRLELFISQNHIENDYLIGHYDIYTKADGTFHHHFHIKWDDICHRPLARTNRGHIKEHDLILRAKLVLSTANNTYPDTKTEEQVITITSASIRVVSDIDDTIKMSNIVGGARAVFRNVFVRDLEETTIPGMGEWYTSMWKRSVRFHYVSNGPIQLLPLVLQFLHTAKLPPGSIKLKSYSARSIFNNLLTAPAERKREGLVEILRSFQDSKFILIGDSGEQDLELYVQLAKAYPHKVLAILVRDVELDTAPIQDPCGKEWRTQIMLRKNTKDSDENGYISGSSRSNSLLGVAIREKFSASRSNSKNWTSSLLSPYSSPPFPPAPLPPLSDDEDLMSPTFLIDSEPEPIMSMDDRLYKASSSKESPWFPSSPTHTSQLSTSPSPTSVLSQNQDGTLASDNKLSLSFHPKRSIGSVSNDMTALATAGESPANATNGRTTTVMFTDGNPLCRSPERTSVLRSNSGKNLNKYLDNQHKQHTVDDVVPPSLSRGPRMPRRNTTNSSSGPSSTVIPPSSPSVLSLPGMSKFRGTTESERKRAELQERVWRARADVPESIVLRIFRHPSECAEVEDILRGSGL